MPKTELQQKVLLEVEARLKDKPWFKGVCTDKLPTDEAIKEDFLRAVQSVQMETEYWDKPGGILGPD